MKYLFILAMVGLAGCSDRIIETTTVTCPKESYEISNSTCSDGKTYKSFENQDRWWMGKRCVNCGGIHHPQELFRDKSGHYFTIRVSSEIAGRKSK